MENAKNDINPIIPPIAILSCIESNLKIPTLIKNPISITAEKHIKMKNIHPPINGKTDNIPANIPIKPLIININLNKDMFIKAHLSLSKY